MRITNNLRRRAVTWATAVTASPAVAQATARRRRCLVMCMNAPLFRWPRPRGAAGVGQGYAARGGKGSIPIRLNPRAVPARISYEWGGGRTERGDAGSGAISHGRR